MASTIGTFHYFVIAPKKKEQPCLTSAPLGQIEVIA